MSGRIVELRASVHREVDALLPSYAAGTLEPAERARVESHLADCPRCRAGLAWERRLQTAYAALPDAGTTDASSDVEQGLVQLRQRIAAAARDEGMLARWRRAWRGLPRSARWAVAMQGTAVAVMVAVLAGWPSQQPIYRALGTGTAAGGTAGGTLVVRFRPEITEGDMRRVLRDSGARLVYGPTSTDAYLLSVPAGGEQAAVARLRQENAVLLVESLNGEALR